jgi:hypothetical protein
MPVFPLPPVPNFRVITAESGHVRLIWADYPPEVKDGHKIIGYRIYRSDTGEQLGARIADEVQLARGIFQFDDTDPQAGPDRSYLCVAVEEAGFGVAPFGGTQYGEPDFNGYGLLPYNSRPFGSPKRGWGEAPFGQEAYGM